ncbi:MAG: flagellar basal body P-ring protein FlgI, partial [Alphaproteobacteria bacterium]|nr:flagellar basal body P-ring protein FlgI [Alphaproteobacteria bacterium]
KYSKTADLLCEKGRFGQKVGKGWYDYVPGKRDAIPNAEVEQMIADHRKALGITPRDMITILQAIKAAGALQAEIAVM